MKLYQIEYFMAVCQCGSISQAADELLVSRPAVSRAVMDLEKEFGIPFLCRTTTGVALTEAGNLFYDKCQKIQQMFSELQSEMELFKSGIIDESDRSLHIGISFTARCCMLPYISAFRRENPNVKLTLTDIEDAFVDVGTLNPEYDLEIALCGDEEYDNIESINIKDSCLAFCCSKNHPLANREHVSLMEIKDEPLVGLSRLENKANQVGSLYARHGIQPNIAYQTQQVSSLRQMIRENLCSSIKPRESMEDDPEIATIPIDEAGKLYLRILWDKNARHNSAFHSFINHARNEFSK